MKKSILFILINLIPSLALAQVGGGLLGNTNIISSGGGGGGSPAGVTNAIQFNAGSGNFGGSNWLTSSNIIQLRPSDYLTENGPFRINTDSASHDVGERRDDITSIGWNQNNEAVGKGSTTLVFEAYCGPSVGCPLPGQSETYFSLDDGLGNSTRPIGMFQSKDGTGQTLGIFRFDSLTFFDRDQITPFLGITSSGIALGNSVLSSSISGSAAFLIGGNNAIGFGSSAIKIGEGGNVQLAPGGDGSGYVRAMSNHFQISSGAIENASGDKLIALAGDGPYPAFNGITGDGEIQLNPTGSSTNLGWHVQSKGNGNIRLDNFSGGGNIFLNTSHLLVGTFPGTEGVTVSGTTCTITAITNGIITAATCTP